MPTNPSPTRATKKSGSRKSPSNKEIIAGSVTQILLGFLPLLVSQLAKRSSSEDREAAIELVAEGKWSSLPK